MRIRKAGTALAVIAVGWMMTAGADRALAEEANPERTPVTMMYFSKLPAFEELVESTYKDVDLVVEQNTSATLDSESERRLRNDHGSDLITTTLPGGVVRDYTYDISAEEFVLNYSSAMTKQLLVNGETHYLPLPGQYYGYIINETLVEELGFSLPKSNQELYEILAAAQEQGIGVGANNDCIGFYNIGENYLANMVFGNYVPDFLSTPEGIVWLSDLQEGAATFSGNVEHCMDVLLTCVEKGYFDSGTVLSSNSVTIANKNAVHVEDRLLDRTMVLSYGDTELYQRLVTQETGDRFAMIPFLSDEGRPGWLISIENGCLAVNKSLGAKGQEKKLEAALKVLEVLSTEDGQRAWMKDTDAVLSYLENGISLVKNLPQGIEDTVKGEFHPSKQHRPVFRQADEPGAQWADHPGGGFDRR